MIYPVLQWLLGRIPELRKRAYLARFLLSFEVPPDMQREDVNLEYKEKQEEFKEIHKQLEQIRAAEGTQVRARRNDLEELEAQRERLKERLKAIKKRMESIPNSQALFLAMGAFVNEQQEQTDLEGTIEEQKISLKKAEDKYNTTKEALREMEQFVTEGGIHQQLQRLEEQVKTNGYLLERLPQEVEEKKQTTEQLRQVINQPSLSGSERANLQQQLQTLRNDVKQLRAQRDASLSSVDDKLGFYRQQSNAIEKKKLDKEATLNEVLQEKRELEKELAEKEERLEEMNPERVSQRLSLTADVQRRTVGQVRSRSSPQS